MFMKFRLLLAAWAAVCLLSPSALAEGKQGSVVGDVYDSACLFTKDLKKPISHECAIECAAGGSPLVIFGDDGKVYWPIDSKIPAQGQNYKLIKYGGKRVKATGLIYKRGSSRAIVIERVEEATK